MMDLLEFLEHVSLLVSKPSNQHSLHQECKAGPAPDGSSHVSYAVPILYFLPLKKMFLFLRAHFIIHDQILNYLG